MALLKFDRDKFRKNFEILSKTLDQAEISWGVVTKILCGHEALLREVLDLGPKQVMDSRVKNLKAIKKIAPHVETVYIKPPAKRSIKSIIRYADISLNTELETIRLLSEEAIRQNKVHRIIIMIELGDLREGVLGENLIQFYSKVFHFKGIKVIGLGANLNCLNGVMPSQDKLIQLALYKGLLEAKFNQEIKLVSGGSSVTLPLLSKYKLPKAVNHFRIGETLFFGKNLFTNKTFKGMHNDVFQLHCEVIELTEKPFTPVGDLGLNPSGEVKEDNESNYKKVGLRAIVDVGLLELDPKFMKPMDPGIKILGASSDMLILEITSQAKKYRIGSMIKFTIDYMGVLGLMNSKYIDKEVVTKGPKKDNSDQKKGSHFRLQLVQHPPSDMVMQSRNPEGVDHLLASKRNYVYEDDMQFFKPNLISKL